LMARIPSAWMESTSSSHLDRPQGGWCSRARSLRRCQRRQGPAHHAAAAPSLPPAQQSASLSHGAIVRACPAGKRSCSCFTACTPCECRMQPDTTTLHPVCCNTVLSGVPIEILGRRYLVGLDILLKEGLHAADVSVQPLAAGLRELLGASQQPCQVVRHRVASRRGRQPALAHTPNRRRTSTAVVD
jgi:hypothetical protein